MQRNEIRLLYDYNYWANHRILDRAAQVTDEQLSEPAPFPSGSLLGTLLHTMGAEWAWLLRWQGTSPTEWLNDADFATLAALRARWQEEEHKLRAFLDGLTDDDLAQTVHYRTLRGVASAQPLWQLMLHVVNHGTQHRSEAAAMLTGFGHSPGDLDLIVFLRETRG